MDRIEGCFVRLVGLLGIIGTPPRSLTRVRRTRASQAPSARHQRGANAPTSSAATGASTRWPGRTIRRRRRPAPSASMRILVLRPLLERPLPAHPPPFSAGGAAVVGPGTGRIQHEGCPRSAFLRQRFDQVLLDATLRPPNEPIVQGGARTVASRHIAPATLGPNALVGWEPSARPTDWDQYADRSSVHAQDLAYVPLAFRSAVRAAPAAVAGRRKGCAASRRPQGQLRHVHVLRLRLQASMR